MVNNSAWLTNDMVFTETIGLGRVFTRVSLKATPFSILNLFIGTWVVFGPHGEVSVCKQHDRARSERKVPDTLLYA